MASPFTLGGFVGWAVVGKGVLFAINQNYPDMLEKFDAGIVSLLTPELTAPFTAGDLITVDFNAYGGSGSVELECFDGGMTLLGSALTTLADGDAGSVQLAIAAATSKVRITLSGANVYVNALDVPGLASVASAGYPSTNAIPANWVLEEAQFIFSHSSGVDSGDGNGSIVATSATGGQSAIKTHTFAAVSDEFYSIRLRLDDVATYSAVNTHYEVFDGADIRIGGGSIADPPYDGRWTTAGFVLPSNASYIKIFVHGGPDVPIYIDAIRLPAPPGSATSDAFLTAPMATVSAEGGEPGATSAASAPTPTLSAFGGANSTPTAPSPRLQAFGGSSAALTGTFPTLFAKARSSLGDNSFVYTAPRPALSAFGGATAKLSAPSPALSITATVVNFGRAEIKPPAPTLSATGTVSGTAYADLTFGFSNGGSYDLVGYGGAVASITLTGSPTVQATGTTGSIGGAQITAPLFELTASGTAQNYGSALLTAPAGRLGATARAWLMAPSATLTAIGTAVVTATYEAYAVNLNHTPKRGVEPVDETTRYTNFPFTHVVRYQNSYFGANATGLYLLEGTTDDSAPITWNFKTATTEFKSPTKKTVASAFFSGRFGPASTIQLHAGEQAPNVYNFTTPRDALAQNHRQLFGKGTKERYYSLGASGTGICEIDGVELDVRNITRRI